MKAKVSGLAVTTLILCFASGLCGASEPDRTSDRRALTALEEQWLHASDPATLDRILAPDFVHVIPLDHFLTKQEHIDWFVKHPEPAERKLRFDKLEIRFYGDVGIVNGTVVATSLTGKELDRTAFTDVFARRDGRWQAVNAQENQVRQPPR